MKISEIYQKYKLMPSLQLHMYRVAGVGKYIAETIPSTVNTDDIVRVGLLHDMGNIIKFNLDLFPEFYLPEGRNYWAKIQQEYFDKYGHDEHDATLRIAREIGVTDRVFELLNAVGFSKAEENFRSTDLEKKIVMYSDMRVEPHGVVSLEQRLSDGRKRWKINHPGERGEEGLNFFERMSSFLKKIEEQLFENSGINPNNITDTEINKKIDELKNVEL